MIYKLHETVKNNKQQQMKDVYISSFHKSNISPYLLFYQKMVFKMLGIELHQIKDDNSSHGDFMTKTLKTINADYFIFFDIDCIPLSTQAITKLLDQIKDNKTIAGAAQTANQFNEGKNTYVGPFFMGISKTAYSVLEQPDLNRDNQKEVDVAGILSKKANEKNIKLKYWYPTHVEISKWPLYPEGEFGIGTTYDNLAYHLFESRYSANIVRFIRKSKETVNIHWKLNVLRYASVILQIQLFKVKMKFQK